MTRWLTTKALFHFWFALMLGDEKERRAAMQQIGAFANSQERLLKEKLAQHKA